MQVEVQVYNYLTVPNSEPILYVHDQLGVAKTFRKQMSNFVGKWAFVTFPNKSLLIQSFVRLSESAESQALHLNTKRVHDYNE